MRRNSIIRIIYGYMCCLSVSLSCLKIHRTHYSTGQTEQLCFYEGKSPKAMIIMQAKGKMARIDGVAETVYVDV